MASKKKKKKKKVIPRDPYIVAAKQHTGAGPHDHPVKKESREKCRKPISDEEMNGW